MIRFDNSYARMPQGFFARVDPTPVTAPSLLALNGPLADRLGLDRDALTVEIPTTKDVVFGATVGALSFRPGTASVLALGQLDGTVTLWNTDTGDRVGALPAHATAIDELAYSPGGAAASSSASRNTSPRNGPSSTCWRRKLNPLMSSR